MTRLPAELGDTAWTRADDVLWHHTVDTVLVLPDGRDEPLTIRGSGVEVWHRLGTAARLEELSDGLARIYDEPPDRIARDVLPFLEELERAGAVRRTS